MIICCKCWNLLFGKSLRLTPSKVVYIFNCIWTHMYLEKRATDNNDQIHFKYNWPKKRKKIVSAFSSTLYWDSEIDSIKFLEESFYFYKDHGMRRRKSKNNQHTAIKWLLMINHKCTHTISFASCLLAKARKNSSTYSQNFLHVISEDKARQDLREI